MLLVKEKAKILGQGITGTEGSAAVPRMREYGTNLLAGVTPGKGGQTVAGVPIYNSIKEAVEKFGPFEAAVQFVPPKFVKDATCEALEEGIGFVLIGAERVPTSDTAYLLARAKEKDARIVGPNSVGLICPFRKLRLGLIGGFSPERMFTAGNVAIISKSGSMTAEIGLGLKKAGLGVSWAVGIGGDRIVGADFADFLLELESDPETHASVIFGELGGTYEERVAKLVLEGKIKKPVVAFIAGEFTQTLPSDVQFGHAGAIIEGGRGLPQSKRRLLKEAGVLVAEELDKIPELIKEVLGDKNSNS